MMKNLRIILLIGIGIVLFPLSNYGQCPKNFQCQESSPCQQDMPKEELSQEEISSLKKMREEEMLAYDVYMALSSTYTMPVFRNISAAEDRHTNAVKSLIDKYELDDPASDHKPGKFQDPHLQETFNKLMKQGRESYTGAVLTGLTIEDMDIADLEEALANEIDNEDISTVYQNLLRASKNHMRAFSFHAEKNNIDYQPSFISKDAYLEIIQSR